MKKSHEDERLNALLEKRVEIHFSDDTVDEGILVLSQYSGRYAILRENKGPVCFYKTHVKNIKEKKICKTK